MIIKVEDKDLRSKALAFAEKHFTNVIAPALGDNGEQMVHVKFPLLRSWDMLPMYVFLSDDRTVENDILGFALLNENMSEMFLLITRPDCKRQGIGSALLERAFSDAAKMKSFSGLMVKSVESAVDFYRRNGFHEVGECTDVGTRFVKMFRKL